MKQQKLLAAILCAATPLSHAANDTLDEIVVTATRFSESAFKRPSNIIVITADDIRNSPAVNLPDILKTIAGINVRPLYGNMGIDATVDMRGFGDTASSNTLILLDGQRLNPIDSGSLSWSVIPMDSIQRIEVITGPGTVPYGDQASGGVINIITNKSGKPKVSAMASLGSYGHRGADVQGADGGEVGYFNVTAHHADTDGWRQNSRTNQQAISGSAGRDFSRGRLFFDYAFYKDDSGLPGYALSAAYHADAAQSTTLHDLQNRSGYRFHPGFTYAPSDAVDIETDFSIAQENYHADYVSFASVYGRNRNTWSITPRLRWQSELGHSKNEAIIGMDHYDGQVKGESNGTGYISPALQRAVQRSTALYAQNSTEFGNNWILSAGVRSQRMNEGASLAAYTTDFGFGPTIVPAFNGDSVRSRNAYDLGLVYQAGGWRAYGKTGTTFRFANTDELFATDPTTGNPVFAGNLRPQHGTIHEIGAGFDRGDVRSKAALYQLNLTDEIGFDGTLYANVNFAPTRRSGLEAELDWSLASNIKARFSYTYTDARFRDGIYAGKEIPLVPRDKMTAQLTWQDGIIGGTYSIVANLVGSRRYSGDFANVFGKLAGYETMDLQAGFDVKPWTITAKLLNIFDKRYAPYAGYSAFKNDHYYYPADARSLFVSAKYLFK